MRRTGSALGEEFSGGDFHEEFLVRFLSNESGATAIE
jgi:hypothetical protein